MLIVVVKGDTDGRRKNTHRAERKRERPLVVGQYFKLYSIKNFKLYSIKYGEI